MLPQTKQAPLSLFFMLRVFALVWLITKILCYKLWLADRDFPLVPVNNSLLGIPNYIHIFLFATMLTALAALIVLPGKKWIIVVMITAQLCSCLLDQNRWQPWEYQYLLMILACAFFTDQKKTITAWQVIAIGLYFFSGLSKFNSGFNLKVWNELILHRWLGIVVHSEWIYRLGYLLPLIEMSAALALIFKKSRKFGVIIICGIHLFNLLLLGPLRLDLNTMVIWPWNIFMPFLLIQLFYKDFFEPLQLFQKKGKFAIIVACCWILPWLNLFGYWDDYLSFVLYSGKTQYLFICTADPVIKKKFHSYFERTKSSQSCDSSLSLYKWAMQEMNVTPNPELRVYREIARQWQKRYDTLATDKFLIWSPKFSKEKWIPLKLSPAY